MIKEINACRICGNTNLESILNLGVQTLTGVFPKSQDQKISSGPLELVKCLEDSSKNYCGLVQLKHSYDLDEMYGDNYGYRSGLNNSMVSHLNSIVCEVEDKVDIKKRDLIIDIGSNDATLLKAYSKTDINLVGIDPAGKKFKEYYPDNIKLIPDFFSSQVVLDNLQRGKAKVITAISMFYDLEEPMAFMEQVYEVLDEDGICYIEQSYMPSMLKMNSYDTICHEHLEFYTLQQIKWITDRTGFIILDVQFNDVNGGSFAIMIAKSDSMYNENKNLVDTILENEDADHLRSLEPYYKFKDRVIDHKDKFCEFLDVMKNKNKLVLGYGASTKGNVVLQYCNISNNDIPFIAEVNEDKYGSFTPATKIPIISEKEAKAMNPDYFVVFPWHFREVFLKREKSFIDNGGSLVMPLPEIEILSNSCSS